MICKDAERFTAKGAKVAKVFKSRSGSGEEYAPHPCEASTQRPAVILLIGNGDRHRRLGPTLRRVLTRRKRRRTSRCILIINRRRIR